MTVIEKLQQTVPPFLTPKQATEWTMLDVANVRHTIHRGVLPAHRLPGGRTRFYILRHELLDWIQNRRTVTKPPHDGPRPTGWADLYPDLPEQMDVRQVGKLLSFHPQVVTRYVASGILPGKKDPDGKWWVKRDELLDYFTGLPHTIH